MPTPTSSSPSLLQRLPGWLLIVFLLSACASPQPDFLADSDVIPVGSRIEFWVDHDDRGWVNSNLHIVSLPREMTGSEARRWAEGIGSRDAGLHWTRYYLRITPPGYEQKTYRTATYTLRAQPYEMTRSPRARNTY